MFEIQVNWEEQDVMTCDGECGGKMSAKVY
jgi:hypothetical protein